MRANRGGGRVIGEVRALSRAVNNELLRREEDGTFEEWPRECGAMVRNQDRNWHNQIAAANNDRSAAAQECLNTGTREIEQQEIQERKKD